MSRLSNWINGLKADGMTDYQIAADLDNGDLARPEWIAYTVLSSHKAIFFGRYSYMSDRYYYMRAKVNGREYSLRGFGVGMIARGKALKS